MRSHSLRGLFAFAIALTTAALVRAEKPFAFAETPGQLPKTIVPRHYTLRLQPDLPARTFKGTARIEFELLQPGREIVLNALELDFTGALFVGADAGPVVKPVTLSPEIDAQKQTARFALATTNLAAGRYALELAFRGKINPQAQGMFFDKYATASGDKEMLGTQFEPTDARRVFPCWDEPVYRATYDITLVVPEKFLAVGNTPITREAPAAGQAGWKEVTFARTPAMPTYLVALFAGEFETIEGEQDGVKLRIITTEGKRESARYALEATKKIVAYYNTYFGTRYPLPKLDQIAVPSAFSTFGAMENWGAIAYIDTALLFDPEASSQARREAVFETIAHEIAHQWFGNLVTMAWWDNLWLNEGFASWMGTKCSDTLNPDWQLWLRANEEKEKAMALDARKTTHPVQTRIDNESQAGDAFDEISYQKGQSFLRMLEAYLGEEAFRAGIRLYMTRHRYSNTTTADLWAALESASGKPVTAIAAGWTEQPGFPVVRVARAEGNAGEIQLEQNRFTLSDPGAAPLTWKIPITLGDPTRRETHRGVLLENARTTLPWTGAAAPIKANLGDTGYYRVFYDPPLRTALAPHFRTLAPADQLNLLADTWAFVENGALDSRAWLDLAAQIGESRSQPVWSHVTDVLARIDFLERDQRGRRAFQTWGAQVLAPQLVRLGWNAAPNESPLDTSLRARLVKTLGRFGDRAVIAECDRRFEAFLKNPATLTGDLRDAVLEITGRHASRETYEKLHALARNARATEEKRRAYAAMQAALDPALARETLALSLSGEMAINEATRNVARVAKEGEQAALAWDYARENMTALLAQTAAFGRNRYIPTIAAAFSDAPRAAELEAVVQKHLGEDGRAEAAKTSDLIRHLAAVKKRELPVIDAWVKERVKLPE